METEPGFFGKLRININKLWNKTVFPDYIKNKKEAKRRQRAEAEMRREIEAEARQEAIMELRPQLKEAYKQQELDRMTGKKKNDILGKLSKGFDLKSSNIGSDEKLNHMLGIGNQGTTNNTQMYGQNMLGGTTFGDTNKLNNMLGNNNHQQRTTYKKKKNKKKQPLQPTPNKIINFENKIKEMMK